VSCSQIFPVAVFRLYAVSRLAGELKRVDETVNSWFNLFYIFSVIVLRRPVSPDWRGIKGVDELMSQILPVAPPKGHSITPKTLSNNEF